jgi:hypothetical protein
MGRTLSASNFPPSVKLTVVGEMFKGQLVGRREQDFGNGSKPVYKFKAVDANCHFTKDKMEIEPPEEGTEVEMIPSTRLAIQLAQAVNGAVYTITRLEDGKKNRFGKCPQNFKVEEE